MVKFRVTRDKQGYAAGQVVDVKPENIGIWLEREWAERITEPETAAIEAPEKAVRKTGKPRKMKAKRKLSDA
jgi:hypothetical protein